MSIKTVILFFFWCVTVFSQPKRLNDGIHPYLVFFQHRSVEQNNVSVSEENFKKYYPVCGTIIHPYYVLTVARFFITFPDFNSSEWVIGGYHMNSVDLDSTRSTDIEKFTFHESFTEKSDPYVPYNLCLVKMIRPNNTYPQSMQAQIAWHVKYSNNKKAYPTQHVNTISIAYWSFQESTQLAVKFQYEFEVTWDWKLEDHPCAHLHDDEGTALYCLKKPTDSFGRDYPCASNTITEGAPIIIDSELSGMFIGISTLDSCNLPTDHREAGALPGLGIAVVNSYQEVSPQHKIAENFLRSEIGTHYSYTDPELGWVLNKTGSDEPVMLQPKPQNNETDSDIFGYNARNLPKCVLDGSSEFLVQKLVIVGGVFLSLYVAVNFSRLFA